MKLLNALILAITLVLAPLVASADTARPAGCNGYGIGTFFDEYTDTNGKRQNCPPSKWESTVGDLGNALVFIGVSLGVIHATGKPVFPLGG